MCEFMSWVEKGGKVYFLTHHLIHETPIGEAILLRFPGEGEPLGHSAIRAYFDIDNGTNRECTDFSTPENFPTEIAKALANGEMRGFGTPAGLLLEAKRKTLYDAYWAKCKTLYDAYEAKCNTLADAYEAKCKLLYDAYWAKRNTLADAYKSKRQTLADAYCNGFWNLFAIPSNRNIKWR